MCYQYGESHFGGKVVIRLSYRYNEISYSGKMAYLYWINPRSCLPDVGISTVKIILCTVASLNNVKTRLLTHWDLDKTSDTINAIFTKNNCMFKSVIPEWLTDDKVSTGPGKGLVSNRQQAIITLTNEVPTNWSIYTPLGPNELNSIGQ